MLFPTIDFAIFFGVVFLGHWLLNPHPVRWKVFMITASYFFYGWWTISYVWLLAAASLIAQLGALGVHHAKTDRGRKCLAAAMRRVRVVEHAALAGLSRQDGRTIRAWLASVAALTTGPNKAEAE